MRSGKSNNLDSEFKDQPPLRILPLYSSCLPTEHPTHLLPSFSFDSVTPPVSSLICKEFPACNAVCRWGHASCLEMSTCIKVQSWWQTQWSPIPHHHHPHPPIYTGTRPNHILPCLPGNQPARGILPIFHHLLRAHFVFTFPVVKDNISATETLSVEKPT